MATKNYEEQILKICGQFETSPMYQQIVEKMNLLISISIDKDGMMQRLTELSIDIFPNEPMKLYRNLLFIQLSMIVKDQ